MNLTDAFGAQVLQMAEQETQGWKMMIGGKWVESRSGKRYTTMNPDYDEPVAGVPPKREQSYGQIIHCNSGTAHKGPPNSLPLGASKTGLPARNRNLSNESRQSSNCVQCIPHRRTPS